MDDAETIRTVRDKLRRIKDAVGWFDPDDDERAMDLRDQVWDIITEDYR